jgi:hypothetical protein
MLLDLLSDWQRIAATIVASGGARVGGSAVVTVREKQIATGGMRVSGSAVITTHVQQQVVASGGGFGRRMKPRHVWAFPTPFTIDAELRSVAVTAHAKAVVTARLEAIASINPETQLDREIEADDEEILLLLVA